MTRGLSLWLDAVRVWVTIIVVISHVAYPRFTRGDYIWVRDLNFGSDAVIVFFVISGLVIAYAAQRDKSLATYSFNRLTRLLSVLLPALLLTFIFDQLGKSIGPDAYTTFYNPASLWELLVRGLIMSNEWGAFDRIRLGTNGPLWSLSYEAAYYVIFAAAFFLTGIRRVAVLALLVVLVGPRVLLLMPAWLLGVVVWNWVASGGVDRLSLGKARLFALGAPLFYVICQATDVPAALAAQTAQAFQPNHYRAVLGFSDEFVWNAMIGIMTAVHIMGMARVLQASKLESMRIRWWAGASFSIYVTHYPALHLIDAVFPQETLARDGLLLLGSIMVGLIFAAVFERRIAGLRHCLLGILDRVQIGSTARSAS
ncbi:MAG: acyltransferase family protein [Marivita sp.]|uniref:acyltransferase family protein n=1 Tax=Marivita sp. TaxID=2003365 RepID=UPI003EF7A612